MRPPKQSNDNEAPSDIQFIALVLISLDVRAQSQVSQDRDCSRLQKTCTFSGVAVSSASENTLTSI